MASGGFFLRQPSKQSFKFTVRFFNLWIRPDSWVDPHRPKPRIPPWFPSTSWRGLSGLHRCYVTSRSGTSLHGAKADSVDPISVSIGCLAPSWRLRPIGAKVYIGLQCIPSSSSSCAAKLIGIIATPPRDSFSRSQMAPYALVGRFAGRLAFSFILKGSPSEPVHEWQAGSSPLAWSCSPYSGSSSFLVGPQARFLEPALAAQCIAQLAPTAGLYGGEPVQWESRQQAFCTLSSAQAEILGYRGYREAMTMGDSLAAVVNILEGNELQATGSWW